MRVTCAILYLFVLINHSSAQKKFNGRVENRILAFSHVHKDNNITESTLINTYGKSIRLYYGYNFSSHYNLSLGFGVDAYRGESANTFPFTINLQYRLLDKNVTPYFVAEGGSQLKIPDKSDGGYVLMVCSGCQITLHRQIRLGLYLGGNYQKSTKSYNDYRSYTSRFSMVYGAGLSF